VARLLGQWSHQIPTGRSCTHQDDSILRLLEFAKILSENFLEITHLISVADITYARGKKFYKKNLGFDRNRY
jgi:hypothetical protein